MLILTDEMVKLMDRGVLEDMVLGLQDELLFIHKGIRENRNKSLKEQGIPRSKVIWVDFKQ